jgi:ubiquinone/menaquinone biosynthesis C-methylase UbiE
MSFDTLAPQYRMMEAVLAGNILQRCRTAFLAEVAASQRALLLGEGPGRFLVALLRANPNVQVTCVERSQGMIQEARRAVRCHNLNPAQVTYEAKDALAWQPPPGGFDLVATHFFLDCFRSDELEGLISKVAASTTENARWLLADFRHPETGWQKWRAKAVLALMYAFFRLATGLSATRLTSPAGFLESAGFRLAGQRLANFGLVHSDLWQRDEEC